MRVAQRAGERGSQLWLQRAVAERWSELEDPIRAVLGGGGADVRWLSSRADDDFAEYRDGALLDLLGLGHLGPALATFWPQWGPQWDALGRAGERVVLVEAKAHIGEFCTPGTDAGPVSRARIVDRLHEVAAALGARHGERWSEQFYQYANRLAHLHFLRGAGVDAYLVLVGFLDDHGMGGPSSAEAWRAAYQIADHVLGLPVRHPLSPFVVHAFPSVARHG